MSAAAEHGRGSSVPGRVLLASASPRRHRLLASLGIAIEVEVAETDETITTTDIAAAGIDETITTTDIAAAGTGRTWPLSVQVVTREIARSKLDAILANSRRAATAAMAVLVADTLVACDGEILTKPCDRADADRMIATMSGRELEVCTSIWVRRPNSTSPYTATKTTHVHLRSIEARERRHYLDNAKWRDKAGGLALQGEAAPFIAGLEGCWSNVVGLPLCSAVRLLGFGPSPACSVELCGRGPEGATDL